MPLPPIPTYIRSSRTTCSGSEARHDAFEAAQRNALAICTELLAMLKKGISCATPKQNPPAQKRTPNTKYNPLQRLPILLNPDDPNFELVHDSAHIQDYLVTKFASMEPKLLTNDVDIDLKAKKIQISVEGVMFAFVPAFFELGREESKRSQGWLEQQNRKVAGSIGAFNDLARKRKGECLIVDGREKTIADIAVVCAGSY